MVLTYLVAATALSFWIKSLPSRKSFSGTTQILRNLVHLERENVEQDLRRGGHKVAAAITALQTLQERRDRRQGNKVMFGTLIDITGSFAGAVLWLKDQATVSSETLDKVLEDFHHSDSICEIIKDQMEDTLMSLKEKLSAGFSCLSQTWRSLNCMITLSPLSTPTCPESCTCCPAPTCLPAICPSPPCTPAHSCLPTPTCATTPITFHICKTTKNVPSKFSVMAQIKKLLQAQIFNVDTSRDIMSFAYALGLVLIATSYDLFSTSNLFIKFICLVIGISILLPLVISAVDTAANRPFTVLGVEAWSACRDTTSGPSLWLLRAAIIPFTLIIPSALVSVKVDAEQKKKELEIEIAEQFEKGEVDEKLHDDLWQVNEFITEAKRGLVVYNCYRKFRRASRKLSLTPIMVASHLVLVLLTPLYYSHTERAAGS